MLESFLPDRAQKERKSLHVLVLDAKGHVAGEAEIPSPFQVSHVLDVPTASPDTSVSLVNPTFGSLNLPDPARELSWPFMFPNLAGN